MRGFHWRLLLLANLAAATASAVFWCIAFVTPETVSHPASTEPGVIQVAVRDNPAIQVVALLSLCVLVGNLLWLIHGRQPKVPTNYVLSETRDGPVKVSREALETSLRTAGEALEEISRLRVSVDPAAGMKRVLVRAQFQAPDGVSIQQASHKLRRTVGLRFQELIRLAEGARLDMDVEFLGFAGKLQRRAADDAEEEPEAFTGPRYPIEDDEKPR